jgi:threonine/homoserine/homoserine lactone efflux protein
MAESSPIWCRGCSTNPRPARTADIDELGAFLGVSVLVICTPGQDTALTIRSTMLGGRRGGFFTAVGVSTGQTIWALAASAGVVAILLASEPLFLALRLAGAAYLVFLGVQSLWAALRPHGEARAMAGRAASRPLSTSKAYRQGVVSNLGNPKMAAFFTSLLPQFAPQEGPAFPTLFALGLLFSLMTLTWLTGYAFAVARASDFLQRPRIRRVLDGLTGAALLALGVRLATERR